MTHMSIFINLLLLSGAFYLFAELHRLRLERLTLYERLAKEFYGRIRTVLEHDDAPDHVLELIEFASNKMGDSRAPKQFYRLAREGLLANVGASSNARESLLAVRRFLATHQELETDFVTALGVAMLAMTYNDTYYGPRIRLLLTAIDSPRGQEEVAALYHSSKAPGVVGTAPAE